MKNLLVKYPAYALMLSFLLLVMACQRRDGDIFIEQDYISDLLNQLKSSPQTFSVPAGQSTTITGIRGTRIHFTPTTFRANNGTLITSGLVDIQLIEMPTAKDMVLNGVTTLTGFGGLLQSGGSINIKVTQNGQPVVVGGPYGIDFLQANASADTMQAFSLGGIQSIPSGNGFVPISWSEIGRNSQPGTVLDSANALHYYMFDSIMYFDWINCDRFYNDPRPKTNLHINLTGQQVKEFGANVFVILPEINAVVLLNQNDHSNWNSLDLGNLLKLPEGMKATFVALAKSNGDYYFAKKENITISTNYANSMQLEKKSIAEIKNEINGL